MHKEEIERKRRKGKNFVLSFHAWNVTRAATLKNIPTIFPLSRILNYSWTETTPVCLPAINRDKVFDNV